MSVLVHCDTPFLSSQHLTMHKNRQSVLVPFLTQQMELHDHEEPYRLRKCNHPLATTVIACQNKQNHKNSIEFEVSGEKKKHRTILVPDTACGEPDGVDGEGGKALLFGSEG